jgi:FkbM family methyltransferase
LVGEDTEPITFTEFVGEPKSDGNHKYYQWANIFGDHKDKLAVDDSVEILEYEVEALTLAGLMKRADITEIDYLKMDIEGAEYDVLYSIDEELANKIHQISFETHDLPKNEKLIKHLESVGYNMSKHPDNEYYGYK